MGGTSLRDLRVEALRGGFFSKKNIHKEKRDTVTERKNKDKVIIKDSHREKAPSNKTSTLTKSTNLVHQIWYEFGTSNLVRIWYIKSTLKLRFLD